MSPEQCKGEDIDRRSDVYALGVLLYELSTTTRLFKGENDYLLMDAIVNGKVPLPRVRRPDLPNELSSIIMRALSVDPNRRYQTAEELRIALDQFAVKAGLTCSTSALATYMRKMFGERPEPWLEGSSTSVDHKVIDVDGPTAAGAESKPSVHHSWTELSRDEIDNEAETSTGGDDNDNQKTRTDGKGKSGRVSSARRSSANIALQDTIAPPISTKETRTSMKMGWESQGAMPHMPAKRGKYALVALPLLALVGFAAWHQMNKQPEQKPAAQPVAATMNPAPAPVAPTVTPAAAPTPPPAPVAEEPPALRVAGFQDDTKAAPPTPAPKQPAHIVTTKKTPVVPTKAALPAKTTTAPTTAQAPAPTPAPAPAPAPAPTPPPAATPPPQPAVAAAPAPQVVEAPQMAVLSNATVSAVASDHSRELGKCEGGSELHGDVAVSFQIDGAGKVVKSQLSTSIKNPKVSACILKSVQGWKFPKPPSGAAKGVYSISYQ
jgi:eukaryotic-like serine/threonine-protein kinase